MVVLAELPLESTQPPMGIDLFGDIPRCNYTRPLEHLDFVEVKTKHSIGRQRVFG